MNVVWNNVEEQFIRENAHKLTDKAGAAALSEISGRFISVYAWRKKRQKMGLRKAHGRGVCKLIDNEPVSKEGK